MVSLCFHGIFQRAFLEGSKHLAAPGAYYGWILCSEKVLARGCGEVPHDQGASVHVASYYGLIAGLLTLVSTGYTGPVELCTDASLVVEQMTMVSSVESPALCLLHERATELVKRLNGVTWRCVSRSQNRAAEDLCWDASFKSFEDAIYLNTNIRLEPSQDGLGPYAVVC
jgi:ribonuclease HI